MKMRLQLLCQPQLALKYNLDIFPISLERVKNKFFRMKIHKPIKNTDYKNKFDLSESLNSKLEDMIKTNPNQWIWTHDRWK